MASGDLGIRMHTLSPFRTSAFAQQVRELIAAPIYVFIGEALFSKDNAACVRPRFGLERYPVL